MGWGWQKKGWWLIPTKDRFTTQELSYKPNYIKIGWGGEAAALSKNLWNVMTNFDAMPVLEFRKKKFLIIVKRIQSALALWLMC